MYKTQLEGPYRLSFEGIGLAVRRRSPGTFALGSLDWKGRFSLSRVGRSDQDLCEELRNFIGSETLFKFAYARDAAEAFAKECELFHQFHPQGNLWHPSRPEGTALTCAHCSGRRSRYG